MKTISITSLCVFAIMYICTSFVCLTFDFSVWGETARVFYVAFSFMASFFISFAIIMDNGLKNE